MSYERSENPSDARPRLPLRIIVVEDDPLLGVLLVEGLEAEGYAVDLAATGGRAVARMTEKDFDVLVCDLELPGIDGFAIIRHFRQGHPEAMIVAMTGSFSSIAGEDLTSQVERAGANALLLKPFAQDALSSILATVPGRTIGARGKGHAPAVNQMRSMKTLNQTDDVATATPERGTVVNMPGRPGRIS